MGTALYLWVRRSPTETQARRRKMALLLGVVLLCLLPAVWEPIHNSRWYRFRTGYRGLAFANDTSVDLRDVEFVLRRGNGASYTNRLETLSARGKYNYCVWGDSVSDLVLERVSCLGAAAQLVSTNVGIAARGEPLSIRLNSTARFVTSHE